MGFSAGGDGVYGITPRMADRFAAVSMSAGHHNWVNPINLMNTPILLQCGDNDTAFTRHLETARFGASLAALQEEWGCYIHTVYMHVDTGHNFADNHDGVLYKGFGRTARRGLIGVKMTGRLILPSRKELIQIPLTF
jgi:dienelactone hydrolase